MVGVWVKLGCLGVDIGVVSGVADGLFCLSAENCELSERTDRLVWAGESGVWDCACSGPLCS